MPQNKHSAERIVAILPQIEVEVGHQNRLVQACKKAVIMKQTYSTWKAGQVSDWK